MKPDDAPMEMVPEEIGEDEDWDQGRDAIRGGYGAYLMGEPRVDSNPFRLKPWENFSGWKRKKAKNWDMGWKLAAIREGEYASFDELHEDLGGWHQKPREPRKALYAQPGSDHALSRHDMGPWAFRCAGMSFRESRHEAIGDAAIRGREDWQRDPDVSKAESQRRNILNAMRGVQVWERVRRPQLTPWEDNDA